MNREEHWLEDIWPNMDYSILDVTIDRWGTAAQCLMAIEECGELITALAQDYRNREVDITEEVADVFIMMSQLSIMLGPAKVEVIIRQKIERLKKRLE